MRLGVIALGGLLALPTAATAQTGGFAMEPSPDLVPYSRFAVTPWVGMRLGYGSGDYFVFSEGTQYRVSEARGGGPAVGVNLEGRIAGPLNAVAGVAYTAADQDVFTFERIDGLVTTFNIDGPAVLLAKAGLQYRLPDPTPDNRRFHPAAYLTVAPAMVVLDWPDYEAYEGVTDVTGRTTHFALNLGADAVSNIGTRGLGLSVGFETFLTFWNQDRIRVRDEILLGDLLEETVRVDYDTRMSNLLMLRAGLSWRF